MVTEEQRRRMEQNRTAALARRRAKGDTTNFGAPTRGEDELPHGLLPASCHPLQMHRPPNAELPQIHHQLQHPPNPSCGSSSLSHTSFVLQAEMRYPIAKKPRIDQGSWALRPCSNSNLWSLKTETQKIGPEKPEPRVEVSLELSSVEQFTVSVSDQSKARDVVRRLLSQVKQLSLNKSDLNESISENVSYHIKDYHEVLQVLRNKPRVILHQIPHCTLTNILKIYQKRSQADHQQWVPFMPNHISDADVDTLLQHVPCNLKSTLLPFQLDGVKYGLRRGGRCLIADDMGVGKTIQAIALAACYAGEGSILITCPASLRLMWAEELERWLPFLLPSDVHLVFGRRNNLKENVKTPKVVVISYTMLRRLKKNLLPRKWAMLIVDESHNLRCTKHKEECEETSAILDMGRNIKRIVLLSGTPSLSRPFDIFHQINLLSPGLLGRNKYEFAQSYCIASEGSQRSWPKDFSKGRRLDELNILLKETTMVRRLKEDVLGQLPPKRRQVIRLSLENMDLIEARRLAVNTNDSRNSSVCECGFSSQGCCDCERDEGESFDTNDCADNHEANRKNNISPSTLSYQEVGIAKIRAFREWLQNHPLFSSADGNDPITNDDSQKMIIFAHHLKVLDSIQEMVHEKGVDYVRVDGSTAACDRQLAVQSFRSKKEMKVAIIGLTAGGVGLDFSSAQTVVFTELPRSSAELCQAEDRAHRRGQKNAVNVYIFCAKDTSDEMQWQSISKSLERVSIMTNGADKRIPGIEVDAVLEHVEAQVMEEVASGGLSDGKTTGTDGKKPLFLLSVPIRTGRNNRNAKSKSREMPVHSVPVDATIEMSNPSQEKTVGTFEVNTENTGDEDFGLTQTETLTCKSHGNDQIVTKHASLSQSEETNDKISPDALMFEVSPNTGRVHLYVRSKVDGYRPTPLEENFLPQDLEFFNDGLHLQHCMLPACLKQSRDNYNYAASFISQWNALRPVDRNCLLGRPLQIPLALELECVKAEGPYSGKGGLAKGGSKRRVQPANELRSDLPEGAVWNKIVLTRQRFLKDREILQAWSSNKEPLCKLCFSPCMFSTAKTPEYLEDLFCQKECYQDFRIKTSQAYLRQELFLLEKGICTICKLDCHDLVEKIRHLHDTQRRQYILQKAPNFKENKRLLERLVSDAKEGNAWHADHIVAVYQGGGECNLQNMRTLCVVCHAKVTAEQNRKRRNSLARAKQGFQATIEKFIERWCEKRMSAFEFQAGNGDVPSKEESNEEENDTDTGILGIKISGSIYSNRSSNGSLPVGLQAG